MGINNISKNLSDIAKKLFKGDGLRSRTSSGGIWIAGIGCIEQGLRFLRNMLFTRLFAPEVFGVMAIVLSINALFESFTQIGIKEAIIQTQRGKEQEYLNGAWWLSFGRAVILYTIAYFCAPWISDFYDNPDLISLMRFAFLSILFNGIMSPKAYVAIKEMKFKRWIMVSNGGNILGIFTAIFLAFSITNVWAIVIGFTVEAAACCIISYFVCPYMPGFNFEKKDLRSLFRYARGVFGLPILTFIFMRSDVFVIGKLCSNADLGLYSMAMGLANMPFLFCLTILGQITLPAFSEIQNDNNRINRNLLKIIKTITFLGIPSLFFVILYGDELLTLVYGYQYAILKWPFVIMFSAGLSRLIFSPITTLFFAIGRPELNRLFTGIRAVIIILIIYPAVKWFGLAGAALASLISLLISNIFQIVRIRQLTSFRLCNFGKLLLHTIEISFFMVLVWFVAENLLLTGMVVNLAIGCCCFLITYVFLVVYLIKDKSLI